MNAPAPNFAGDMTWNAVTRRLEAGAFAILPIGAVAKQHSRHLPMRADALQAEWLAARLAERVPALVWPTLNYGHYPAFAAYSGSCSLSASVFEAVIGELAASLLGYGARGVVLIDTGLSNLAPIVRAIAKVDHAQRVLHLKIYGGPRYRDAVFRLATEVYVGRADELKTSCLLAIAPDLVTMDCAEVGLLGPTAPGPLQNVDPSGANFSASGGLGDPTRASAAKGRMLLAAMVEDMVAAVSEAFAT